MVYGREEEADTLIEQMTRDQDPIIRYGGMYALALAYRGTANNKAIRQLLHFAVSDVSDDVRRTAVLALGFVLYSEPEQVGSSPSLFWLAKYIPIRIWLAQSDLIVHGLNCSSAMSFLFPLFLSVVFIFPFLKDFIKHCDFESESDYVRRLPELFHCCLNLIIHMFDMVRLLPWAYPVRGLA